MPNPLPALSVLWPVIGFLVPAFAIHAGFDGRRAGGLIAIILYRFERGLFFVTVAFWTILLVFFTAFVLVFVGKLKISHHIWWKTFIPLAFAFGIFRIAGGVASTGFFPLGASGQCQEWQNNQKIIRLHGLPNSFCRPKYTC